MHRRDFLRAGSAAGLCLLGAPAATARPARAERCILLFLTGGPSHLETWDPKPDAPAEVRGPFGSIPTSVPGLRLGEHLPRTAAQAQHLAVVRSLHHAEAPIHEAGLQLMQTGRLSRTRAHPHIGAVLSQVLGPACPGMPPCVLLPRPIGSTGVAIDHGQGAGYLDRRHAPACLAEAAPQLGAACRLLAEPARVRERYGRSTFGTSCLLARRLIEHGVRCVAVNMFDRLYNRVTWDCHAAAPSLPSTLDDYRRTLCPTFDVAFAALIDDLAERGLLATTLVVVLSEFGRTPHVNAGGGRDHWPGAWSAVLAGGGVRGGQVVGATDRLGAEPRERPVTPADFVATMYAALGVDVDTPLADGIPVTDGQPMHEVLA